MFKDAVRTKSGAELDAKIKANQTKMKFTKIKMGKGIYSDGEDLELKENLKSIQQEFSISSITVMDGHSVQLRMINDNCGIQSGYHISELGVFAEDFEKGEILYSIAIGVEGKMDYQPSESELPGSSGTIDIYMSVSNSKLVDITVHSDTAASAKDLLELRENKVNIIVTENEIAIEERKERTFYFLVTEKQIINGTTSGPIKVSPNMGLRIL